MHHWVKSAISLIEADFQRSSDTHLYKIPLPAFKNIHLYIKDESTHPTGSLKHRLARSLFLYGLCNGQINETTTIVEASSGSTAISEAYFSQLLQIPFIAVVPEGTSQEKIDQISFYQGKCHTVKAPSIYYEAERLAKKISGHYMDQFTFAERATDWRGNNNIAQSIFNQMKLEPFPEPSWIVVSAGTGGTSATIGRYLRYQGYNSKLCVADPTNSVFYDYYLSGDHNLTCRHSSMIEGIGRPRVEPSFIASVIDRMIKVPDQASVATIKFLEKILNCRCGGSTGTNVYATFQIINELNKQGKSGSIITMLCDSGVRYNHTLFNDDWLKDNIFEKTNFSEKINKYKKQLEKFYYNGIWENI